MQRHLTNIVVILVLLVLFQQSNRWVKRSDFIGNDEAVGIVLSSSGFSYVTGYKKIPAMVQPILSPSSMIRQTRLF